MSDMIRLEHVQKTYRRGSETIAALSDFNLAIPAGAFIAVVGPSGSGKSTLLNLVGCVDKPSHGTLTIDGTDISTLKETQLAAIRSKKIGFIFQQFFLLPTLTALENVLLPTLFSRNGRRRSDEGRASRMLELVGLSGRAKHLPAQLSGGEMQRVAIARALINEPRILLADEPTGNLDTANAESVYQILTTLHAQGLTVVVVTHNLELAARAEQTIQLRDGRILIRQD